MADLILQTVVPEAHIAEAKSLVEYKFGGTLTNQEAKAKVEDWLSSHLRSWFCRLKKEKAESEFNNEIVL